MLLIKLDAIDSTNTFLKDLAAKEKVADFTTVTAESQTGGRGQMGAKWISEPGKNLTMSVLVNNRVPNYNQLFALTAATALAVKAALDPTVDLKIKWPNDIMAGDKKLGGILIENIFLGDNIRSVIGIGVNVNQTQFDDLPNATSLAVIAQAEFEITTLLEQIVENIKYRLSDLNNNAIQTLAEYNQHLFRRGETTLFRSQAQTFSASIIGVGMDGLLQIEKVDGTTAKFNLKEVEMMY